MNPQTDTQAPALKKSPDGWIDIKPTNGTFEPLSLSAQSQGGYWWSGGLSNTIDVPEPPAGTRYPTPKEMRGIFNFFKEKDLLGQPGGLEHGVYFTQQSFLGHKIKGNISSKTGKTNVYVADSLDTRFVRPLK